MFTLRLACLSALVAAGLPAGEAADRYRSEIERLDATRPESVCLARTALRQSMPKADIADRAAMFRAFREFYLSDMQSSASRFEEVMRPFDAQLEDLKRRPEVRRAAAPWSDCGFTFDEEEGMLFPAQNSDTLLEFVRQLPADLAEYTRFQARELAQKVGGDAALALSWEQLRERLARWEEFSRGLQRCPRRRRNWHPPSAIWRTLCSSAKTTPGRSTRRAVASTRTWWRPRDGLPR